MLNEQNWIHYERDIMTEWQQCRDEGRAVTHLEEACRKGEAGLIAQLPNAPMREDYPYCEPSDWAGICAQIGPEEEISVRPETLKDRIAGAWTGRISGCLLGKPLEGIPLRVQRHLLQESGQFPIQGYLVRSKISDEQLQWVLEQGFDLRKAAWADQLKGAAPVDDDTNYTLLTLLLYENYGKDFTSNDVLENWLTNLSYLSTCTAERVTYKNAACGLLAPETATVRNPFRELVGAQIRGDFFGYVNPGRPHRAAEAAFRDARISHVKNGIYGEMMAAAMVAAAAGDLTTEEIVRAGLREVPPKSRLYEAVEEVLRWRKEGRSAEEVIARIHATGRDEDLYQWVHVIPNAMIVVMSLLWGEQDFSKSLCLSVQAGLDTDCNGATVGSVMGMRCGAAALPQTWIQPHQNKLRSDLRGESLVTVEDLTARTLRLID